jgi:hypothetical protein
MASTTQVCRECSTGRQGQSQGAKQDSLDHFHVPLIEFLVGVFSFQENVRGGGVGKSEAHSKA